jgi:hypothetical protein
MTIAEYFALEVGDRVAVDLTIQRISPGVETTERVVVEVTGAMETFYNVKLLERVPGSLELRWRAHEESHHTPAKVVDGGRRLDGVTSQHLDRLTLESIEVDP